MIFIYLPVKYEYMYKIYLYKENKYKYYQPFIYLMYIQVILKERWYKNPKVE